MAIPDVLEVQNLYWRLETYGKKISVQKNFNNVLYQVHDEMIMLQLTKTKMLKLIIPIYFTFLKLWPLENLELHLWFALYFYWTV